jgi:hypothetical protein
MHHLVTRAFRGAALAVAIAVSLSCAAGPASAVTIEEKKAQREAALAEIERMQGELQANTSEYVAVARRIAQTQEEISKAASESVQLDGTLI